MLAHSSDFVSAGPIETLKAKRRIVVRGRHRPILVVYERGRISALDNRCPHMGFPLDRGTIEDGILTCHWHHARFDVESGCTFDLWADDVPTYPIEVRDGEVWVKVTGDHADPREYWRDRLASGLQHNIGLIIAKGVHGQLAARVAPLEIVRQVALFGAQNRDGWGTGLTILTALANVLPELSADDVYLALFHGARHVASDCAGEAPRRERAPLASRPDAAVLSRWMQRWTLVRHRDAAERTLLTAVATGLSPALLADALLAAATERPFADSGHTLDFINKAFELLDLVGWQHASAVLLSVVGQMVMARGADESTAWRQPVDLISLCDRAAHELRELTPPGAPREQRTGHTSLAQELLADDPTAIVEAIKSALRAGASHVDLGRALSYAAALRVAQFGTANEHADWETAHHVFTYANALYRMLMRIPPISDDRIGAIRGVLHGAMALYLTRYLNVPPAHIPGANDQLDDLPADGQMIRMALLDAFDRQRQVDLAAWLVARHFERGEPSKALIRTLAAAVLREDARFHSYQMLEAGIGQFAIWGEGEEGRNILIGVARYLAAHSPTERAALQTADIARRLMAGGELHKEAGGD